MNKSIVSPGRPRIALATDALAPAGIGEHMLALAGGLRDRFEPVLAFSDCGQGPLFLDRARELGFATQTLPSADPEEACLTWLRESDLQLLHVHAGTAWEGHLLMRAAKATGLPLVRTEHLPLVGDETQRREHLEAMEAADRLVVVSESAAQTYREAGLHPSRIKTVRNGIAGPVIRHPRFQTRERLGLADSDTMLLTVARFNAQKGHAVLVEAMAEVADSHPQARLFLAGDGPLRESIERSAKALGLEARITFLGERSDVGDLLVAADLFVLPSLFEGLPLVILEAMASRLPVVATRVGGTVEALGEAHPWLAEPANPAALARCIEDALGAPEERSRIGEALRQRYRRHFRLERMADETASVYRSLLPGG